jgi:Spy/CpxP family protein refolding chaperone
MSIKRLSCGVALAALLVGAFGNSALAQRMTASPQGSSQGPKPAATQAKPGPPPQGPQRPPDRKPWWSDDTIKKELGLSADQSKTLEQIFTSTKDELAGYSEVLIRESQELDRLINESKVERWVVARQIDKEETARSNFNKLRLMTNYRMHQVLTPEQRTKLQQIRDRDHKDPRKHP